ncbi:MAG: S8 family peptidase [Firmicutes bacterium]|nr:S8 family peptidase [Bacillota bacterium]
MAAGNGIDSDGKYCGIAPEANIVSIKILSGSGKGNSSDVLAGIQWLLDNKEKYNIKIANFSIGAVPTVSDDPLVRAIETVWDKGIIVTTAAGNNGPSAGSVTSPGISRKVITVGSSDDNNRISILGNSLVNFSGRGPTKDCIKKPDVVAPGANITSCLTPTPYEQKTHQTAIEENYTSLSGTSMSTPMVTGALALLLQKYPDITPNTAKLMLKKTCTSLNYSHSQQGWGLLNIKNLLQEDIVYVR